MRIGYSQDQFLQFPMISHTALPPMEHLLHTLHEILTFPIMLNAKQRHKRTLGSHQATHDWWLSISCALNQRQQALHNSAPSRTLSCALLHLMSDTQQVIIHCVFSRACYTSALPLDALEVNMAIGQVILHGFLKSNHRWWPCGHFSVSALYPHQMCSGNCCPLFPLHLGQSTCVVSTNQCKHVYVLSHCWLIG